MRSGHNFHKCIRPKVNVIIQLEFELAYYKVAVKHVSHSTAEYLLHWFWVNDIFEWLCIVMRKYFTSVVVFILMGVQF